MKYMSEQWVDDSMHWRGKVLIGRFAHRCPDWDFLPMDETCPEWPCPCSVGRAMSSRVSQILTRFRIIWEFCIRPPQTYNRGYAEAVQAAVGKTDDEVTHNLVNGDVYQKNEFDYGWVAGCHYVLRKRGWTADQFADYGY